jgi:hypothetical protein
MADRVLEEYGVSDNQTERTDDAMKVADRTNIEVEPRNKMRGRRVH